MTGYGRRLFVKFKVAFASGAADLNKVRSHKCVKIMSQQDSNAVLFLELSRLAEHSYNLTLTTMASNNDLPTDMDFQNATLPKSGNSTPERPSRHSPLHP
ncbi:hypothetical protein TNCV_2276111 [Trichonephila clavipes]|nr:hypothetical protein TNCV_2276111 [Trichonephila clavipes]